VSEEMNQLQENQPQVNAQSWEAQLQQRANELLAQRIKPLKAEIESLQSSVNEISARLLEQTRPETTEEEGFWLVDHVRQWFTTSNAEVEQGFNARLEQTRREAEEEYNHQLDRTRQELIDDFNARLDQTRSDVAAKAWEDAEREFESRLEAIKRDWQAAADADFQRRLEAASTDAGGVARRESQTLIDDLEEQLEASRKALTLAVSSSQNTSFDALRAAVVDIDEQRSQSDTLTMLVRRAANFAPRIVFFVLKGGDAVGWKASGFENGLSDETAKLLTVRAQTPSLIHDAISQFQTVSGDSSSTNDHSSVLGLYGAPAPERAVAIPLVVRGKAAAVLYADSGGQSENSINVAALETLLRTASMGIELLPARRGVEPFRPPNPSGTGAAAYPPAPAPTARKQSGRLEALRGEQARQLEEWQKSQEPAPTPDTGAEPSHAPAAESEPEPSSAYYAPNTEEIPAVQAEISESTPVAAPVEAPAAAYAEETRNEFTRAAPSGGDYPQAEYRAEEQYVDAPSAPSAPTFIPQLEESFKPANSFTPQIVQPSVPTPASETEQRAHNDARRFARLLVSEIKLYNAAKVNDGRRYFDLYERLREEIDRSRKVYDKRVSPSVAARFDYFYDELVQTLAEGDPSKLGNNCPGPVVLAS
jgi:hypothetical protein